MSRYRYCDSAMPSLKNDLVKRGCQPGGMHCLQGSGSGFSAEHLKRAEGELHSPTIIMSIKTQMYRMQPISVKSY